MLECILYSKFVTLPVKSLDTLHFMFFFIFMTIYIVDSHWRNQNYEWTHMELCSKEKTVKYLIERALWFRFFKIVTFCFDLLCTYLTFSRWTLWGRHLKWFSNSLKWVPRDAEHFIWDGMSLQDAEVAMLVQCSFNFEQIPNSVTSKAAPDNHTFSSMLHMWCASFCRKTKFPFRFVVVLDGFCCSFSHITGRSDQHGSSRFVASFAIMGPSLTGNPSQTTQTISTISSTWEPDIGKSDPQTQIRWLKFLFSSTLQLQLHSHLTLTENTT